MSDERRSEGRVDVLCLSHLRWDFVFQRPQHLLSRCARDRRVFFVEEPLPHDGPPRLDLRSASHDGVEIAVPRLPHDLPHGERDRMLAKLVGDLVRDRRISEYVLWYYTPMALAWTRELRPRATLYDCMDELSGFAGAPPELAAREAELLGRADLVLTGGQSLYEAKRGRHPRVYAFPSSVDAHHFAQARELSREPPDQAPLRRPRAGFYGVIDERLDRDLVAAVADLRPGLEIVMLGPVAKIDPRTLPRRPNLHWLGPKTYAELPSYLAGWDVALLPFSHNAATRFISPTKTPEYLAAGKPVVSTSIRDVVRPYGELGLARIADGPEAFAAAIDACLAEPRHARLAEVDALLADTSWDRTWARIDALLQATLAGRLGAEEALRV
jgi:glycosyltransferase involved in cell wall biosynthesis